MTAAAATAGGVPVDVAADIQNGWIWIILLCTIGVGNLVFFWKSIPKPSAAAVYSGKTDTTSTVLAGIYVFVCVYRSVFMTDTHARMCFTDTVWNWPIMNRGLAAVAEISFGVLGVRTLRTIAVATGRFLPPAVEWYTRNLVVLGSIVVVVANTSSTIGVVTHHSAPLILEECLWFVYATTSTIGAGLCVFQLPLPKPAGVDGSVERKWQLIRTLLYILIVAGSVFAVYLAVEDIPMYIRQYRRETAPGVVHPVYDLSTGLADSSRCHITTKRWSAWTGVWLWQTLYFTFGPIAVSLQLRLLSLVRSAGDSASSSAASEPKKEN